ncbi:ribosomal protein L7/L12 [Clostridium gasigenes]|nr:ribosomal protein L7/L12 [Clostridium gasigenes]
MSIIEKKSFNGFMFLFIGILYFYLSITKYKDKDKSNKIVVSDIVLENMNIELKNLIEQGEKIKAIKRYRIVTGLGLKEAKDYVDSLNKFDQSVVSDTMLENIDVELKNLIAEGKRIKAIKKYRIVTGLGLKEAKDYVDSLSKFDQSVGSDTMLENIDVELKNLIEQGEKIKAIKRYRIVTGLGLKEAKDYVDSLSEKI